MARKKRCGPYIPPDAIRCRSGLNLHRYRALGSRDALLAGAPIYGWDRTLDIAKYRHQNAAPITGYDAKTPPGRPYRRRLDAPLAGFGGWFVCSPVGHRHRRPERDIGALSPATLAAPSGRAHGDAAPQAVANGR